MKKAKDFFNELKQFVASLVAIYMLATMGFVFIFVCALLTGFQP